MRKLEFIKPYERMTEGACANAIVSYGNFKWKMDTAGKPVEMRRFLRINLWLVIINFDWITTLTN